MNPIDGKAAGVAAAATAFAAAACTACCILPLTLPAVILVSAGGVIAVLDHAHGWATKLAIAVVIVAWAWLAWRWVRTKRRIARSAIVLMTLSTLLTTTTAAWPWIEPAVFNALGVIKAKAAPRV
ncbi:hypothetical protein [Bradyrhizobium sp.]|uniref:hypothetical protein n=1 Tax=Bradyrhizobium sp. TaxID=376 RepID=UPI001DEBD1F3|nr:hypothetical protein [Bradyrhizobium sp.]MBV8696259.1 hypothetical protein [Bradyrhizobium sp.]MBV8922536.1 hypothetical protein [Bradyrhizobium sp.]